jgi:hypothetical protein
MSALRIARIFDLVFGLPEVVKPKRSAGKWNLTISTHLTSAGAG